MQKMAAREERVGGSRGRSPSKRLAFPLGQQPAHDLCMLAFACPAPPHTFLAVSFHLLALLCDAKTSLHFFILFMFFLRFSQDPEECCP